MHPGITNASSTLSPKRRFRNVGRSSGKWGTIPVQLKKCPVSHRNPAPHQTESRPPSRGFNAPLRPESADGSETTVWTPDPGRALITGVIDGDPNQNGAPFFTSLNSFKISTLWGVKNTAPYFHDNSAMTLEEVVDHYSDFVFSKLPPPFGFTLTKQDRADIVAYMTLLD
jgi:hypothetical protein